MRLDIKKMLRTSRETLGYPEGAYLFLDVLKENLRRKVTTKELAVEFFRTKLNFMENPDYDEMEKKEVHAYRKHAIILLIHLIEEEGEERYADELHEIFFREFEFNFLLDHREELMKGSLEANIAADWIANMLTREKRANGEYADCPMLDADSNEETKLFREEVRKEIDNSLEAHGTVEIGLEKYLISAEKSDFLRILPCQLIAVKYCERSRVLWEK